LRNGLPKEVWESLQEVPFRETRRHATLAGTVGRPTAVRTVGRANGMNTLAIIVPCHCIVRADEKLVGYAAGLWRKRGLHNLEREVAASERGETT